MGYSTAQRYLRSGKTTKASTKKPRKRTGFRLSPQTDRLIVKMLRGNVPAALIAERTGAHLSSVYTRRKRLLSEGQPIGDSATTAESGIPAREYAEFEHANKETWEQVWNERREPTDGEVYFTMAWRRRKRRVNSESE